MSEGRSIERAGVVWNRCLASIRRPFAAFLRCRGRLALGVEHRIAVEIVGDVGQSRFKPTSSQSDTPEAARPELRQTREGVFDSRADAAPFLVAALLFAP